VAAPDQIRSRLSAGRLRAPGAYWVPPIDPVEHVSQLRHTDRDDAVGRRRPQEPATLQPLGVERHANAVMPQNLNQMTSSPSEDVQIAGMRITLQYFLDLQRQAVHPTPHVGVADCQPNPHPRRDRDHRPDSALTTATANPAGIEAGMGRRAFPANSISIAGHPASSPTGAIRTWAKPWPTPSSRRQRPISPG